MRKLIRIRQGEFSLTYLGCLVFYGRKKNAYFKDIIKKISKRILSWQYKFLSFGGKLILIRHVLQSMPVYLLSAMNPTKVVLKWLHLSFARFFWGNTSNERRKCWASCDRLCYPVEEGQLGVRSLIDVNKALMTKL